MPKTKAPANRTKRGQFAKGQSGNPTGRPKEIVAVRDLARLHTLAAVLTLVDVMKKGSDSAKVSAAQALLDRGWGKAMQPLEHTGEGGGPIEVVDGRDALARKLATMEGRHSDNGD